MNIRNTPRQPETPPTRSRASETFSDFRFMADNRLAIKILPYLIFLATLGVAYIANRHYTERVVRKVTKLRKEVEELRVDYTTRGARYNQKSTHRTVTHRAKKLGLREGKEAPILLKKERP